MIGRDLGAYRIVEKLGEGGMGEVYRAHDARLTRDVAIKVLPASVSADADRLRRFEQEARATAALNHPNILVVYDVGRVGETVYVVEELLQGQTLREALSAPLPTRKIVDYASQIATGLAAAHEKQIIHRDLKPENIFVTHDGRIKILDFGLAKSIAAGGSESQTSTRLAAGTEPGVVLGTVGYMAPEQVRGQAVDHRADIFSLGAVLYEMITGRRAFAGDTAADTITALLKEAPADPAESGRPMPPALARIVWRCLEKNPALRFQSAPDLAFALQSLSTDSGSDVGGVAPPMPSRRPALLIPAAALVAGLMLGITGVWLLRSAPPTTNNAPIRFTVSLTDGVKIDDLTRAVLSPDGLRMAIGEAVAGDRQLTVLTFADGTRKNLGTIGLGAFGWSPDGTSIAYFGADRAIYKVSLGSEQRQRLAAVEWAPTSLSWSSSGDIIIAATVASTLTVVPSTGGAVRNIFAVEPGSLPWATAQALPDGRQLLLSRGGGDAAEILIANADGSGTPTVIGSGGIAQFVPPDVVLALRGNQIVAWRANPTGGPLRGQPTVLADGLLVRLGSTFMGFSASETGMLVYRSERHELATRLAWFDRTGRQGASLSLDQHCRNPELSPEFDRVAIECYQSTGGRDIWVYDLSRDAATRITTDNADDADPVWTPDGRTIIFASSRRGSVDVFSTAVGGGRAQDLLFATPGSTPVMTISPDGLQAVVLATSVEPGSGLDLMAYPLKGQGSPIAILKGAAAEIEAQFSPDGKFLIYGSNQSGRFEVYAEPWPQTGERWPISTTGGTDARWSHDGREIFYLAPDRTLMSVRIRTSPSFVADRPVELFQTRVAGPLGLGHRFPYAVSKDGTRFLMYVSDPNGSPPAMTVISNWEALLR